jgi:hypothetical protein
LFLDEQFLSLGAMCWAACGKDQGFTPYTLLEFAKKNMKFRAADLAGEHLVTATTLANLKEKWMSAAGAAEDWFAKLPATEAGCLYLDKNLTPFSPIPGSAEFVQALRHFGSLRGAWPRPS